MLSYRNRKYILGKTNRQLSIGFRVTCMCDGLCYLREPRRSRPQGDQVWPPRLYLLSVLTRLGQRVARICAASRLPQGPSGDGMYEYTRSEMRRPAAGLGELLTPKRAPRRWRVF